MEQIEIKHFVEAAMLAAGRPLTVDQLKGLFDGRSAPENKEIRAAIAALNEDYEPRGIEVVEVASGYRIQVRPAMTDRLQKLWEERPPRYSRALFETLALIAYRQPITRGEIEEVRGVAVSSNIVRSLMERDWIRVVGHRDVPGRPAMFGTTKGFLDYFGLKKLDDLPELADLADWESLRVQLDLPEVEGGDDGSTDVAAVALGVPGDAETAEIAEEEGEPGGSSPEAVEEEGEPAEQSAAGGDEVQAIEEDPAADQGGDNEVPDDGGTVEEPRDDEQSVADASVERVGDGADMVALEAEPIEEALLVSEWPDSGAAGTDAALDEEPIDDGKDASARG
jgi:segregation and condensation protein B